MFGHLETGPGATRLRSDALLWKGTCCVQVRSPLASFRRASQTLAKPVALIAELSARAVLAEQRLGDIRELLTQARQDIERWRDQADAWREQASTSQRQLTDQREREPVSLWRWLRPTG